MLLMFLFLLIKEQVDTREKKRLGAVLSVKKIMASEKRRNKFSVEDELRLIHEVEKRPILWDSTSENYKRADLKPQVWAEVATNVGPAFTGEAVSARFKSLRDTFTKNWRKIQESKTSGSGTDDVYTPKWTLFTSLTFLQKTCVQQGSTSNIPSQASQISSLNRSSLSMSIVDQEVQSQASQISSLENQSSLSMAIVDQEVQSQIQIYFDENLQEYRAIPSDESAQPSCSTSVNECNLSNASLCLSGPSSPDFVPPRPASAPNCLAATKRKADEEEALFSKRGKAKKTGSTLMEEAVRVMKDICKQQPVPSMEPIPTADREELFGNYVASRLRLMTVENKKQCENAIMAVLMDF